MTDESLILVKCAGECGKLARVAPDADECSNCGGPLSMPNDAERRDFEDDEKRAEIRSLSEQLRKANGKLGALKAPELQAMTVATAMQTLEDHKFERVVFNIAALDPNTPDPKTTLALVITIARAALKGVDMNMSKVTP